MPSAAGTTGQEPSLSLRGSGVSSYRVCGILDEVRRELNYPLVKRYHVLSAEEIDRWVIALALIAEPTEGSLKLQAVDRDPDDDKYLVAALEGRAGYLVSGDSDLLELHEYRGGSHRHGQRISPSS